MAANSGPMPLMSSNIAAGAGLAVCSTVSNEMALDDVADKGRLTIAIGAGKIELTTAVDLAIAIVVSFALEQPLISHFNTSLSTIFIFERVC